MCTPTSVSTFYLFIWRKEAGWGVWGGGRLKSKQWEVLQPPQLLPVRFKGLPICFQDLNLAPVLPFKNGQDAVFYLFYTPLHFPTLQASWKKHTFGKKQNKDWKNRTKRKPYIHPDNHTFENDMLCSFSFISTALCFCVSTTIVL